MLTENSINCVTYPLVAGLTARFYSSKCHWDDLKTEVGETGSKLRTTTKKKPQVQLIQNVTMKLVICAQIPMLCRRNVRLSTEVYCFHAVKISNSQKNFVSRYKRKSQIVIYLGSETADSTVADWWISLAHSFHEKTFRPPILHRKCQYLIAST